MTNTVGHRNTEVALQLGLLYNPSEALKIGLVDQLVPEDQVLTTAKQNMTKWLAIPGTMAPFVHPQSTSPATFFYHFFSACECVIICKTMDVVTTYRRPY